GYSSVVAYTETAALTLARITKPALVLLELEPPLNGYAVASKIRQDSELSDALLVGVTTQGRAEDRFRMLQAGFDFFTVKPTNPEEIFGFLQALRILKQQTVQATKQRIAESRELQREFRQMVRRSAQLIQQSLERLRPERRHSPSERVEGL